MAESRILAVDHLEMQARIGCEGELLWFYGEVIGLSVVAESPQHPARIRFRSADLELRYTLVAEPRTESTAHRATLLVSSLWETRKVLDDARMRYVPINGATYTDRLLSLLDPGGNRVAIRQTWRLMP